MVALPCHNIVFDGETERRGQVLDVVNKPVNILLVGGVLDALAICHLRLVVLAPQPRRKEAVARVDRLL